MVGTLLSGQLSRSNPLPRCQQAAFTLLELLIVIFIISLISTGFIKLTIGFGSATQSLENETKRLHRILSLAAQEAIMQGSEVGLLIEIGAYRFVTWDGEGWMGFDTDSLLQRHQLPQNWRLELMQDEEIITPAPAVGKDTKEPPEPTIAFYASGEMTSFQLRIYSADHPEPTLIVAKENGEIEMHFQELDP